MQQPGSKKKKHQDLRRDRFRPKHARNSGRDPGITPADDGTNPDRPDPKLEAQAEALVKQNGFASLAEYDDVTVNIAMIMSGIDRQTKTFTEPPDQIKKEINSIKANKAIPEAQKREDLAQLEAALKDARPIQFKENIAMVLKYFDQLPPLFQEERPAD